MTAAPTSNTGPYDLGRGYSITFRLDGGRLDAVWEPGLPTGRRGRQLLPAYRKARDTFLRSVAGSTGMILVIEP